MPRKKTGSKGKPARRRVYKKKSYGKVARFNNPYAAKTRQKAVTNAAGYDTSISQSHVSSLPAWHVGSYDSDYAAALIAPHIADPCPIPDILTYRTCCFATTEDIVLETFLSSKTDGNASNLGGFMYTLTQLPYYMGEKSGSAGSDQDLFVYQPSSQAKTNAAVKLMYKAVRPVGCAVEYEFCGNTAGDNGVCTTAYLTSADVKRGDGTSPFFYDSNNQMLNARDQLTSSVIHRKLMRYRPCTMSDLEFGDPSADSPERIYARFQIHLQGCAAGQVHHIRVRTLWEGIPSDDFATIDNENNPVNLQLPKPENPISYSDPQALARATNLASTVPPIIEGKELEKSTAAWTSWKEDTLGVAKWAADISPHVATIAKHTFARAACIFVIVSLTIVLLM